MYVKRYKNGQTWEIADRDRGPLTTGVYFSIWRSGSVTVFKVQAGLVHFHRLWLGRYQIMTWPVKRFRRTYRRSNPHGPA